MINAYSYIRYFKKEFILGPTFKMLEVAFELIMPFLMSYAIDVGIEAAQNYGNYNQIIIPGLLIFLLAVLGLCSTLVCQHYASIASQGYGTKLRDALYSKIMNMSLRNVELIGKGNLNTVLSNDVNRLQVSVAMMIRLVLRAPTIVIGSIICAFIIDWHSALIFLGVVILISLILFFILKVSSKKVITTQKKIDKIVTLTNDSLNGIRVIKAFNNEKHEVNKFKEKTEDYYKEMKTVSFINALTNPLTFLIINVAIVLVVYFSSNEIISESGLTTGELTSLIQYLNQCFVALIAVSNLVIIFTRAFASKKRVEELLNLNEDLENNGTFADLFIENGQNLFEFKDVSFKYNEGENNVVKDLNFTIKKGERVGIIGGTGSGKTTLIKLIERFFDRSEGEILYKGHDIKDYNLNSLHHEISLVNQKAVLFKGTIKSNLLIGKKDASESEMIKALKDACAYDFVKKYDDFLDHQVEENGRNFSGGQKQRLSIARALIKNSETLILDDSTSALDYLTEKELKRHIFENKNLTIIIIAQRVSSLLNCDKIIVMYHGQVESIGTHEELLKTSKVYKEIYSSQYGEGYETN